MTLCLMPISQNSRKLSVGLVAVPESSAAVTYGLHEVFSCVGNVWENLTGEPVRSREMQPRIVGVTTDPIRTTLRVPLVPDSTFADRAQMDVVIVPDLFLEPDPDLTDRWPEATEWLKDQRRQGAIICSVCTGALMLAQAGFLDGREATTHWSASALFKTHYPGVDLRSERVLVPSGPEHDIVTSGGSASWTDLSLYLIARFCGEEEARHIAKIFMFGDRSQGQLPFATMVRPRQHTDAAISECQQWIAENYEVANPVAEMTARSGLTERTFKRRFRTSTGYTPIDYVQSLRVEEAKHLLETTNTPVDDISEQVGYEDSGSFRRLFKRQVGVPPQQYRQRYQA
ncbi:GlxA family transcriptional regulator [Aliiruegeria lutimaris]|uniref:Transcriptional regulator, AraC family with amidase-like domain n=1 Tax=Aliiruegeria lutimaris TaxID=571298 RepID=A0A1G9GXG5_9RHOB|nr:helix-turn-helix domain-containing protein [Aliiruegeria lutimaris]SDL04953.1 transcriptional regulator, AraC family with amidase-like domain [Aliiruegeria lutimaris]